MGAVCHNLEEYLKSNYSQHLLTDYCDPGTSVYAGMHFVSSISHNTSISSTAITSLIFQMEKPKLRHVKSLSLGGAGIQNEALFPFPEHGGL